jgi:ABC-type Mn2+/Zn2+ transport system ATPase subunit
MKETETIESNPTVAQPLPDEPARLEMEDVRVGYNGQLALEDLTFQVQHGARLAVVGPNGAGKTTLFKALVGLIQLQGGRIRIHGQPLGHHQDCVAYVPQREEVDWRFPVTVSDVVMMGRYGQRGWLRRPDQADHAVVAHSLEQLGIADLAKRPIGELSSGQQQRVFLARALAQEPHILLMDEPFTGVDFTTQEATLTLLEYLQTQQVTAMVSTHDLTLASERFEQVLLLNRRLVASGTPQEVFTQANLSRAFGSQVLFIDGVAVVDQCCPPEEESGEWPIS